MALKVSTFFRTIQGKEEERLSKKENRLRTFGASSVKEG